MGGGGDAGELRREGYGFVHAVLVIAEECVQALSAVSAVSLFVFAVVISAPALSHRLEAEVGCGDEDNRESPREHLRFQ